MIVWWPISAADRPEYMRATMDTPLEPTAGDTTTAIALKVERQAVLPDKSKQFEFLLTESALRWQRPRPDCHHEGSRLLPQPPHGAQHHNAGLRGRR